MTFAKRLSTKPSLARCPSCGKRHRIRKSGVMYHVKCPKSGSTYRVFW